jgi:sarcosine/dimethylglycine N-methyltransferase
LAPIDSCSTIGHHAFVTESPNRTAVDETKAFYEGELRAALEALSGEHLHLGLFTRPDEPLLEAQARATRSMADPLAVDPPRRVLEVACGVGQAARHLAGRFSCAVTATNISERQLALARTLTEQIGLDHLVTYEEADYHALPYADGAFDTWWCQEALLHSPNKRTVLGEARRVLEPGGRLVLSDLVVPRHVDDDDRARIYARVQTSVMWDAADYEAALHDLGFDIKVAADWSGHVAPSYAAMRRRTDERRAELERTLRPEDIDRAQAELDTWVAMAEAGKIGWVYYMARRA